jgi:hypothetical protein
VPVELQRSCVKARELLIQNRHCAGSPHCQSHGEAKHPRVSGGGRAKVAGGAAGPSSWCECGAGALAEARGGGLPVPGAWYVYFEQIWELPPDVVIA